MDSTRGISQSAREMFQEEPDRGHKDLEVSQQENVYSYFQFLVPIEEKDEGKTLTIDILMAYFLVILCIAMQGLALFAIFKSVVVKDFAWQDGVMTVGGKTWGLFSPKGECNDGGSLCLVTNGKYSCAPPSVQLTGRWAELDTDGDGAWSLEEAQASQEVIKCKYAVDPTEVFDVFTNILLKRENLLNIHPDVRSGKKIHKPYFDYIAGDVITCGYANSDMCPNLLKRGFYDAALELNSAPRVGNTTTTALKYCRDLLKPGGTCEELLPSTYSVWKKESVAQCGDPDFDRFVYTHPLNGRSKSLLSVDYSSRQQYEKFQTPLFFVYKFVIVFLWGLVMMSELKTVGNLLQWTAHFPAREGARDLGPKDVISGISKSHRIFNVFIGIVRLMVIAILIWIGTLFLLKSGDYVDLLFDAVAVVFILEFGDILYSKAIRQQLRDEVKAVKPMRFKGKTCSNFLLKRPGLVDLLWVVGLFIVVGFVMSSYYSKVVAPVYDALQCTCIKEGDHCVEAKKFSYDFWYEYWSKVVPDVYRDVEKIMTGTYKSSLHLKSTEIMKTVFHVKHPHHHHYQGLLAA